MQFRLTFDCDNAAFGEDVETRHAEIATILGNLQAAIRRSGREFCPGAPWIVRDSNGNTIGRAELIDPAPRREG